MDDVTTKKEISVHSRTQYPTSVWKEYQDKKSKICELFEPLPLDTPLDPTKVRFVCISDTHSKMYKVDVPPGDILLHAGDFTFEGKDKEIRNFNKHLGNLPHKYKIVIAGNHELSFKPICEGKQNPDPRELLTNCIYLEDQEIEVYGYRIYGSPWQPEFFDWAFNLPRGDELLQKWNMIPDGIDVLITHGPPLGHGDSVEKGQRTGCVELLESIEKRIKPKYHLFGHIHEGYGCTTNRETVFINASICTLSYRPTNKPVIFDLPLKDGQSKL